MNKPQTRLLALLLVLTVMLGMTACASPEETSPTEGNRTIYVPEPVTQLKCTEMGTPLADIRVRQALAYAIDLDTIIEALFFESAQQAATIDLRGQWLDAGMEPYPYDPDQAKELLAEAGWPGDYVLDVVYYQNDQQTVDFLTIIGSYWEAVGIKAEFRRLEGDPAELLWKTPEDEEADSGVVWDLAYIPVAALSDSDAVGRFHSGASNNSHTPGVEGLDALIEKAAAAEEQTQKQLYGEIRELLAQQVCVIPLLCQKNFIYISDDLDTASAVHGNDLFSYEKDILNWTTTREDETLYTDGGPESYFCTPVVNPGQYLYQELVFERLLDSDSNLNPTDGLLAESYTLSEDGKTVEFTLREDLLWHDGEALTGEDVKFTFELYMRCPGANSVLADVLDGLEGAQAFKDGDAEDCSGITLEENKVTFRFEEPSADALRVFAQWPILPKHALEKAKPEKLQQHKFWKNPIGSGPYKVSSVKMGDSCTLERWEDYWKTGEGNIRYIHMAATGITDGNLTVFAAAEQLDYAFGESTEDAAYIAELEHMTVEEVETGYTRCFFINQYPHASYIAQREAEENATAPTE